MIWVYLMNSCFKCGKSISPDSEYCNNCGAQLKPRVEKAVSLQKIKEIYYDNNEQQNKKSKWSKKPSVAAVYLFIAFIMAMIIGLTFLLNPFSSGSVSLYKGIRNYLSYPSFSGTLTHTQNGNNQVYSCKVYLQNGIKGLTMELKSKESDDRVIITEGMIIRLSNGYIISVDIIDPFLVKLSNLLSALYSGQNNSSINISALLDTMLESSPQLIDSINIEKFTEETAKFFEEIDLSGNLNFFGYEDTGTKIKITPNISAIVTALGNKTADAFKTNEDKKEFISLMCKALNPENCTYTISYTPDETDITSISLAIAKNGSYSEYSFSLSRYDIGTPSHSYRLLAKQAATLAGTDGKYSAESGNTFNYFGSENFDN